MTEEPDSETDGEFDWEGFEEYLRARFDVVDEPVTVAGHTYQMLHPRSADDLISERDFDIDERLPYWAEIWPSSRVLAERLAERDGRGQTLLELGTGSGLAAIVARRAGFDVLATDYYQEALDFCLLNAHRNGVPLPMTRLVDWRRWPLKIDRFDAVVASDVLYEWLYSILVADIFSWSMEPGGWGLMADPGRKTAREFPEECRQRGLITEPLGEWAAVNGQIHQTVKILSIRWDDRSQRGSG